MVEIVDASGNPIPGARVLGVDFAYSGPHRRAVDVSAVPTRVRVELPPAPEPDPGPVPTPGVPVIEIPSSAKWSKLFLPERGLGQFDGLQQENGGALTIETGPIAGLRAFRASLPRSRSPGENDPKALANVDFPLQRAGAIVCIRQILWFAAADWGAGNAFATIADIGNTDLSSRPEARLAIGNGRYSVERKKLSNSLGTVASETRVAMAEIEDVTFRLKLGRSSAGQSTIIKDGATILDFAGTNMMNEGANGAQLFGTVSALGAPLDLYILGAAIWIE